MMTTQYNTVTVDLGQLQRNFDHIQKISQGKSVMAVVKADAYGHGAVRCTKALWEAGCRQFAVASVWEAVTIAPFCQGATILILGATPPAYADILTRYRFCQCVHSLHYARSLSEEASGSIAVHLKFDSGMRRIGFSCEESGVVEACLAASLPHLQVCGIFSHLADSAHPTSDRTQAQIAAFSAAANECRYRMGAPVSCHLCNSDALLYGIDCADTVRAGIALYGYPTAKAASIQPILTWESEVISTCRIEKGEFAGYGDTYCAKERCLLCTIPLGYADGFCRRFCHAPVKIGVQTAQVAAVCMDMTILSLPATSNVTQGEKVTLIGKDNDAWILAEAAGTIPYEILCRIGQRQRRIYCTSP